LVIFKFFIYLK